MFDADRAALLTEVVLAVGQRFGVSFDELHNDSTSISFCGNYHSASGRHIRGRSAPEITYGHSKAHRPDLKQLQFILAVNADGNIPVAFRCDAGNTSDSRTHIETWNALRAVAGRPDFLYVADSKLCSRENMDYIDRAGGRLITVMPRNRLEDKEFRLWIQTNTPDWESVWDRPTRATVKGRETSGRFIGRLYRPRKPGRRVWSTLLTLRQEARRRRNIAAASEQLQRLRDRLADSKTRLRGAAEIYFQVKTILDKYFVGLYLKVTRTVREEHLFKQTRRERPGFCVNGVSFKPTTSVLQTGW